MPSRSSGRWVPDMISIQKSRPSLAAETAPEMRVTAHPQDTETLERPHLSPSEIAQALTGYALIVRTDMAGHPHRRLYLSWGAATAAAERAQRRGHAVHLESVRLVRDGGGVL